LAALGTGHASWLEQDVAFLLTEFGKCKLSLNKEGELEIPGTALQRVFHRAPGMARRTASAIRMKLLRLGLKECVIAYFAAR
jgi:hypothetical protein